MIHSSNQKGDVSSADQDAWVAVGESLRAEIAKLIPQMGAMKPDEVKTLIGATQAAMWMHFQAATWDKRRELEMARVTVMD